MIRCCSVLSYHDSAFLGGRTNMSFSAFLWAGISVPLVFLGAHVGYKQDANLFKAHIPS